MTYRGPDQETREEHDRETDELRDRGWRLAYACPQCGRDTRIHPHTPAATSGECWRNSRDADLPAGATAEPWTDDDTAELAREMADAAWTIADRHSEARTGGHLATLLIDPPLNAQHWAVPGSILAQATGAVRSERVWRDWDTHPDMDEEPERWPILAAARDRSR
jgi:hypothetical protein